MKKTRTLSETTVSTDSAAQRILKKFHIPFVKNSSNNTSSIDFFYKFILIQFILVSLSQEEKQMIENEKLRLKEEKRLHKVQQKEITERRKIQLRALAAYERRLFLKLFFCKFFMSATFRRRNLSSAIDLLLTWLRLMTTFAILVGHIHKILIPKYIFEESIYDNPDLLMVFTYVFFFFNFFLHK